MFYFRLQPVTCWASARVQLLLNASDYLDFITIVMLAMGLLSFQMPAITYVLSRIGM